LAKNPDGFTAPGDEEASFRRGLQIAHRRRESAQATPELGIVGQRVLRLGHTQAGGEPEGG